MKSILRLLIIVFSATVCAGSVAAQCANNNAFWTDITPGGVGQIEYSGCMYGGEYCTATVCLGAQYTFSTCGESYDTQITLYSSTGTYLAYDDDGCTGDAGPSNLVWTATFSGVVWVLVDEYNCISNNTCTDLSCTQNTSCPSISGCSNNNTYWTDITPSGLGSTASSGCMYAGEYCTVSVCQGAQYIFSTCSASYDTQITLYTPGGSYLAFDDDGCTGFAGPSYLVWTATYTGVLWALVDQYDCLSNNTCTTLTCTQNTACSGGGCAISNVSGEFQYCDLTDEYWNFWVDYTGGCTVSGMWLYTDLYGWEYVDLSFFGYTSGEPIDLWLYLDYTYYEFYFVLSDGTESQNYSLITGGCDTNNTCSGLDSDAFWYQCIGNQAETDFYFYYSGNCTVDQICIGFEGGPFTCYDAGGAISGDYVTFFLNYPDTWYEYYYQLDDGTYSPSFYYYNGYCGDGGCSSLDAYAYDTGCTDYLGDITPSADFYFDYVGTCDVVTFCIGLEGNEPSCFDLSGGGYVSGSFIGFYLFQPDAWYTYYYMLDDGSISSTFYYLNGNCNEQTFICDCQGTQHDAGVLDWLGDGFADDGSYTYNGQPVYFNCPAWGFDCGDIDIGGFTYDPYGVCSGNLPPANGCIQDEPCNYIDLVVATDCYPEETEVYLFDENGNVVFYAGNGVLDTEYTEYTFTLCLPYGCYTFGIFDVYGDGISTDFCEQDGYYYVYDYGTGIYYANGPAAFGSSYYSDFCIGPESTCSNLDLSLNQAPCQDNGDGLFPTIGMEFDFVGDCQVINVCFSEDGGDFVCTDVSSYLWFSGSNGVLINSTPDASYAIYYMLDDGSVSPVFYWQNGNCDFETTICDCAGTQHTIGVLDWLGDGYADNGFYQWNGQYVDFNCAIWGYDCGDIAGAPDFDPYGVCSGGLPPDNGCFNDILGCTDPDALNYNPDATVEDGSCLYDLTVGCTYSDACNYNPAALFDDGSCEYVSCAGCTDDTASNYDAGATIDDGSCLYEEIEGCTDAEALNFDPIATLDDGTCVYECIWPEIIYDAYCVFGDLNEFYISVDVNALGNGAPYTLTNSYDDQQVTLNFNGVIELGPYPNGQQVLIQVVSNLLDGCFITSALLTENCSDGVISGCIDILAENFNPDATEDDGSCQYDFMLCDCDNAVFSPADRLLLGNGDPNTGVGDEPNFNCAAWGYDCGDIDGAPDEDPYNVCFGNLPEELIATATGCPLGVEELQGEDFAVFPNPGNGLFSLVNGTNSSDLRISVYDNAGKLVFSQMLVLPQRSTAHLDMQALAQGTYTMELIAGDRVGHRKLVIQK